MLRSGRGGWTYQSCGRWETFALIPTRRNFHIYAKQELTFVNFYRARVNDVWYVETIISRRNAPVNRQIYTRPIVKDYHNENILLSKYTSQGRSHILIPERQQHQGQG